MYKITLTAVASQASSDTFCCIWLMVGRYYSIKLSAPCPFENLPPSGDTNKPLPEKKKRDIGTIMINKVIVANTAHFPLK